MFEVERPDGVAQYKFEFVKVVGLVVFAFDTFSLNAEASVAIALPLNHRPNKKRNKCLK
jgi:hypothetical protein